MREFLFQIDDQSYPIWLGKQCRNEIVSGLRDFNASSYHVVTDQKVDRLHASALCEQLSMHSPCHCWVVKEGESAKSLGTVEALAQSMVKAGVDRGSLIVAFGGGVVGNLAGLIAAMLFRGIRFVHVPTTLIAAADSVASLKQAVNLSVGKNLIGCYHAPLAVYIDIGYLQTLSSEQVRSGMYEIIKNALVVSVDTIPLLEEILKVGAGYSSQELMTIVECGLRAKQKVMRVDKCERNEALVFEYGHTVGHAIELAAEGRVPHGEAVALGMVVAAEVSVRMGQLSIADRAVHHKLLSLNGLNVRLPDGVTVAAVMALLRMDNKRGYLTSGPQQIAMILLERLGDSAGPPRRPLVLVDASLLESCISDCLA